MSVIKNKSGPAATPPNKIIPATDKSAIRRAADIIGRGGLVAFPTETVYGLGADACNPAAVAKIFEAKKRPSFDPLIIHIADPADTARYARCDGSLVKELADQFWPGPLTLVLPKTDRIPPIVSAGLATVAIRIPDHATALGLIRASGTAIAAPSANPFGYISPTCAAHVQDQLGAEVDLILDGGRCRVGVESTILSLAGEVPIILRAGGTAIELLEEMLGPLDMFKGNASRPQAPGQLSRHYATSTPLEIAYRPAERIRPGERIGLLSLLPPASDEIYAAVEILSRDGDLREAASNLFSALRRLDGLGLDRLVATPVPETGLGIAIMDRLRRCSVSGD
jgi:L-threonylcarbamoyladenylate synthase